MGLKVLYASDQGYIAHMATSIYSLLCYNSDIIDQIYIFTVDISMDHCAAVKNIGLDKGVEVSFVYLDDSLFEDLPLGHHFQKSNYYRLFAASFIDSDKCLYIDADTLILESIEDLLDIEMSDDTYLAAVENPGFNRHDDLRMTSEARYFNSGLMLLNLDLWRSRGVKDCVVEFVRSYPSAIKFVDQCGLNAVVNGDWLELHPRYNFQTSFFVDSPLESEVNPCIVHFTGSGKPWHFRNSHPLK